MMHQIISLFLLIALGFFLRRINVLPPTTARVLSILETHILLPALAFKNMSTNFHRELLENNLLMVLVGAGFLLIILLLGYLLTKSIGEKISIPKNILLYIFIFPNYGYFGYPVINAVFGEKMLFNTMIFAIPISVAIYSIGIYIINHLHQDESLSPEELQKLALEKTHNGKKIGLKRVANIFPPALVALVLGILWGVAEIPLPKTLNEDITLLANCMGPIAMLLTGFVLASYPLGKLFASVQAYIVSLIRLLIIPFLVGIIFWSLGLREHLMIPVIISAMPVGLNIIVFPESIGRDTSEYARICFASYILSIFTIPLVFMVLIALTRYNGIVGG